MLGSLAVSAPASAAVINAIDSGWYNQTGTHVAQNDNYLAGEFSAAELRNFIVFDLTAVVNDIVSASLLLYNPDNALPALRGYVSPDPTETYQLYDVSTPIATLSLSNVGATGIAIFDDLGSGTVLGQQTVSAADNGAVVSIVLNADGIAALNAARGGQFAIGGALTTLGSPGDEFVFGFAELIDNPEVKQLQLTSVPEPATVALLGLAATFAMRRAVRRT
jgi:hypothetical protein